MSSSKYLSRQKGPRSGQRTFAAVSMPLQRLSPLMNVNSIIQAFLKSYSQPPAKMQVQVDLPQEVRLQAPFLEPHPQLALSLETMRPDYLHYQLTQYDSS